MRRRKFIKLIAGAATWPLTARAQEPGRTYRLGLLVPLPREAPINVAVFDEMRRRGFIEGQNLTVEYRDYGQHPDRISEYAAELVKARVDVIVTAGSHETIRAAQQATKTIPIVGMAEDLVGSGLVRSMARPNGRLVDAAHRQMRELPFYHTFGGKSHDTAVELAERLVDLAAVPMSKVFFANSGSEANDTAIKLVWYYHNSIGKANKCVYSGCCGLDDPIYSAILAYYRKTPNWPAPDSQRPICASKRLSFLSLVLRPLYVPTL